MLSGCTIISQLSTQSINAKHNCKKLPYKLSLKKIVIVIKNHCQIETFEYRNIGKSSELRQFRDCQGGSECPGGQGRHYGRVEGKVRLLLSASQSVNLPAAAVGVKSVTYFDMHCKLALPQAHQLA